MSAASCVTILDPNFMVQLEGINYALTSSLSASDLKPLPIICQKMNELVKKVEINLPKETRGIQKLKSIQKKIEIIHATLKIAPKFEDLDDCLSLFNYTYEITTVYPLKLKLFPIPQIKEESQKLSIDIPLAVEQACSRFDESTLDILSVSLQKITRNLDSLRNMYSVTATSSPLWAYCALDILKQSKTDFLKQEYQEMISAIVKSNNLPKILGFPATPKKPKSKSAAEPAPISATTAPNSTGKKTSQ